MFAYRFPLNIVYRIYDILFAEGIEIMFRVGIALLKHDTQHLITLNFEDLLDYLKNKIFLTFVDSEEALQTLITEAVSLKMPKSRLDKLKVEFIAQKKKTESEQLESETLKQQNKQLQAQLKKMEAAYEQLNLEHIKMSDYLLELERKKDQLVLNCEGLTEQVGALQSLLSADRNAAEDKVKEEMDRLADKNLHLTQKNAELDDRVMELEDLIVKLKNTQTQH